MQCLRLGDGLLGNHPTDPEASDVFHGTELAKYYNADI